MIRVGLIRFLVTVALKPENGGKTAIILRLTPQAKKYKAIITQWQGLRSEDIEQELTVQAQCVSRIEYTYELKPHHIARFTRELAKELAGTTVNHCINVGAVAYADFTKTAAIYLVEQALLNAVRDNSSDAIVEQVEMIDLVADMIAMKAEREVALIEAQRIQAEAYEAHQAEYQALNAERLKHAQGVIKKSLELLKQFLTKAEREELDAKGHVTINIAAGSFVVPVTSHGLVKQYVGKEYISSYCIVFQDYSLPVGDEALMKIALLKADPDKFFKTANKFHEYHFRRHA